MPEAIQIVRPDLKPVPTAVARTLPLPDDLSGLLAPIPGRDPAGESLRYSGVYDAIQEARREDDAALPQGVWKTNLKRADWPQVMVLAMEALETRSKDLQLAVWLLEAWLQLYGVPGIVQGLRLILGLCEGYWDGLHPRPEEEDPEYRLAPLHWLDEKLSQKVALVAVTRPADSDAPAYTLADWESALYVENLAKAHPGAAPPAGGEARATPEKFLASVAQSPSGFYAALARDLRLAAGRAAELEALLASLAGDRAPGLHRFRAALERVEHLAHRVLEERDEWGYGAQAAAGEEGDGIEARAGDVDFGAGGAPIHSRAEAYRLLSDAADYLLRTEPHSPAPYLVKRAVAWGGMSLVELLAELLATNNDLKTIYNLLGIREPGRS